MAKSNGLLERATPLLFVLVVIMAFAIGVLWQRVSFLQNGNTLNTNAAGNNQAQPTAAPNGKLSADQAKKLAEVTSDDHVRGATNPKVWLVEYTDLECPYCKQFHTTAQQAVSEYGGELAWVYRQFPLTSIHPSAQPAAEAAECVASVAGNDAFWKFVDSIFEGQPASLKQLDQLASAAGAKGTKYTDCVKNSTFKTKISDQATGGQNAGVAGTPGNFIVNSKGEVWSIPGAVPYSSLKATIDEALSS